MKRISFSAKPLVCISGIDIFRGAIFSTFNSVTSSFFTSAVSLNNSGKTGFSAGILSFFSIFLTLFFVIICFGLASFISAITGIAAGTRKITSLGVMVSDDLNQ